MIKCIYCGKSPLLTGDFNSICSECRSKGFSEFKAPSHETFAKGYMPKGEKNDIKRFRKNQRIS